MKELNGFTRYCDILRLESNRAKLFQEKVCVWFPDRATQRLQISRHKEEKAD